MFEHLVRLSLRFYDQTRGGELLSRLSTDVGRLLDAIVAATTSLVPNWPWSCGWSQC
jgi:ABC-type multidrug transport system fused ATPase/permease subunit